MDETILARRAVIVPLGDAAVLVRFADRLDDEANRLVLALVAALEADPVEGVVEIVPSLVSVLLRYDPERTDPIRLAGEIGLRSPGRARSGDETDRHRHLVSVRFDGPDLEEVAAALGLDAAGFIDRHNAAELRVLATGFAPGFVYCGFHPETLVLPRRRRVRPRVPAGSVLFAAGQTAIAATEIPTGWHVIGTTDFRNFDPRRDPPTRLAAGDAIRFEGR